MVHNIMDAFKGFRFKTKIRHYRFSLVDTRQFDEIHMESFHRFDIPEVGVFRYGINRFRKSQQGGLYNPFTYPTNS